MDALLSTYMDWDFFEWLFSYLSLLPVGIFLGLVAWAFGYVVDVFVSVLRRFF